jgi:hypothetical protein
VIIEKPSILNPALSHSAITHFHEETNAAKKPNKVSKSTEQVATKDNQSSTVTVDDWKNTICSKGFQLVNYQFRATSDRRKSHIFVFAACPIEKVATTAPVRPLYIKQDFNRPTADPSVLSGSNNQL